MVMVMCVFISTRKIKVIFQVTVRYNPRSGKGALQLDYVYPLGKGISGYFQIFQGYGQSLIDYNHEATSFGVGLMLNDWMGL